MIAPRARLAVLAALWTTTALAELPPLAVDPATRSLHDLWALRSARVAAPPVTVPDPRPVLVEPVRTPWPLLFDEETSLRAALIERLARVTSLHLAPLDVVTVNRAAAVPARHPGSGAACAGRSARSPGEPPLAVASWAHSHVACAEATLDGQPGSCTLTVAIDGPSGATSASPRREVVRLVGPVAPPFDVPALRAAIAGARDVAVVPPAGLAVRVGNTSFLGPGLPLGDVVMSKVTVFRGAAGTPLDATATARLAAALRSCRVDGASSDITADYVVDAAAHACQPRSWTDPSRPDDVDRCVCAHVQDAAPEGTRLMVSVVKPTAPHPLGVDVVVDLVSTTDPAIDGSELLPLDMERCLAPRAPTAHAWRRARFDLDATGHVVALEAAGSPLPEPAAACLDDLVRRTGFGCPAGGAGAIVDVVLHVFPRPP